MRGTQLNLHKQQKKGLSKMGHLTVPRGFRGRRQRFLCNRGEHLVLGGLCNWQQLLPPDGEVHVVLQGLHGWRQQISHEEEVCLVPLGLHGWQQRLTPNGEAS